MKDIDRLSQNLQVDINEFTKALLSVGLSTQELRKNIEEIFENFESLKFDTPFAAKPFVIQEEPDLGDIL